MKKLAMTGLAAIMLASPIMSVGVSAAEENRKVDSFKEIELKGSMDVYVTVGKKRSLRVVADDDMMDKIVTDVKGDTLVVKLKRGRYHDVGKMKIYVTVKNLEGAEVKGSGDMTVKGTIKSKNFEAAVKGSGDLVLENVKANDLELDIMGSGDMSVTGSCDTLDLDIMGSGNLEAKNVKCDNAKVAIMGSGDADIHANKSLTATIMGSGDITVYGNPAKIKSRVAGSGDIREK